MVAGPPHHGMSYWGNFLEVLPLVYNALESEHAVVRTAYSFNRTFRSLFAARYKSVPSMLSLIFARRLTMPRCPMCSSPALLLVLSSLMLQLVLKNKTFPVGVHQNKDTFRENRNFNNIYEHGKDAWSGALFHCEVMIWIRNPRCSQILLKSLYLFYPKSGQRNLVSWYVSIGLVQKLQISVQIQMATLSVQEAMGFKVDREAVATLVLPQLWAMSMGPR